MSQMPAEISGSEFIMRASASNSDSRLPAPLMVVAVSMMAAGLWSCDSPALSESDTEVMRDIYCTGLHMPHDPYVRAETLRAMKLSGDPALIEHAEPLVRDDHPMVRVAAIDALLTGEHPEVDEHIARVFGRGDEEERFHLLDLVLNSDDPKLRDSIAERADDTESSRIRRHNLEATLIDELRDDGDEVRRRVLASRLSQSIGDGGPEGMKMALNRLAQPDRSDDDRQQLVTALGRYVRDGDPIIEGMALRALVEEGQPDRAEPLVEQLEDESNDIDERVDAARALVIGRAPGAKDVFADIVARADTDDPQQGGIPDRPADERLVRYAQMGMVALGDDDSIGAVQRQLRDATTVHELEILDALSVSSSADTTVTLRNRVDDSESKIRHRAIELYAPRDDARGHTLIDLTSHEHLQTRLLAASLVAEYFPSLWQQHLEDSLESSLASDVRPALRILQELVEVRDNRQFVEAHHEALETLANGQRELTVPDTTSGDADAASRAISALASYLLFRLTDDRSYAETVVEDGDRSTQYALLEVLVDADSDEFEAMLRDHLYDDRFPFRLMAATALWNAFGDAVDWDRLQWCDEDDR